MTAPVQTLRKIAGAPLFLWIALALPAIPAIGLLAGDSPRAAHVAVHPTGEWAARFMIVAMMATPLALLLKGWSGPRWLLRNRRYFGVAAFVYAAAHAVLYLIDKGSLTVIVHQLSRTYIWTGWLAFAVFIPLAATSMDCAIRAMGPKAWKSLQRWVYAAAVLTFVHWASLHDWGGWAPALVHFSPLIALSVYRLTTRRNRGREQAA